MMQPINSDLLVLELLIATCKLLRLLSNNQHRLSCGKNVSNKVFCQQIVCIWKASNLAFILEYNTPAMMPIFGDLFPFGTQQVMST
jgi:hypothetical protein